MDDFNGFSNAATERFYEETDNYESMYLEKMRQVSRSTSVEQLSRRLKMSFGPKRGVKWAEIAKVEMDNKAAVNA